MTREALVGLVFTIAIVLFAAFAFLAEGWEGFGARHQTVSTTFPNVAGLELEDNVTLAGKEIGRVIAIQVEGDAVRVDMRIARGEPVKADSVARLQSESLLGGRVIDISIGSGAAPEVPDGGRIEGRAGVGLDQLVDSVGGMSADVRQLAQSFQANQEDLFARLGSAVDEAHEAFATINRVLGQNEASLNDGMKAIGDLGPRLDGVVTRLDNITAQIESGQGTLGRLVYDESLYDEVKALAESLNGSAARLSEILDANGEDVGAALQALADAGPQFQRTMERVESITRKIDEGQGTLGKLVNDEQLYTEATRAVKAVGDAAENAREQGPISTFTGAAVGAAAGLN